MRWCQPYRKKNCRHALGDTSIIFGEVGLAKKLILALSWALKSPLSRVNAWCHCCDCFRNWQGSRSLYAGSVIRNVEWLSPFLWELKGFLL